MKYKLLKKWNENQLEEVGHVFEEDDFRSIKYLVEVHNYHTPILIKAGFLEEVEESKIQLWSIDEIEDGDTYYHLDIDANIVQYNFFKNGRVDEFSVKSGQAHKTKDSAELYYKQIMNN